MEESSAERYRLFPAFVSKDENAAAYWLADSLWLIRVNGAQTKGEFAVVERVIDKRMKPEPHSHPAIEESIYIIEGQISLIIEKKEYLLGAGDFSTIPKNTSHHLVVKDSALCRLLTIYKPAGIEDAIRKHGKKMAGPSSFYPQ